MTINMTPSLAKYTFQRLQSETSFAVVILKYIGAEPLFQAEGVVFEIDVPPESLENNSVPRYQLVKLCTESGSQYNKIKQENSLSSNGFPRFLLRASTFSLSLFFHFA